MIEYNIIRPNILNHLIDAAKQKAASIKCQDHNTIEHNII